MRGGWWQPILGAGVDLVAGLYIDLSLSLSLCIYIYIHIEISLSLYLSLYLSLSISLSLSLSIHIYIYIYIYIPCLTLDFGALPHDIHLHHAVSPQSHLSAPHHVT